MQKVEHALGTLRGSDLDRWQVWPREVYTGIGLFLTVGTKEEARCV